MKTPKFKLGDKVKILNDVVENYLIGTIYGMKYINDIIVYDIELVNGATVTTPEDRLMLSLDTLNCDLARINKQLSEFDKKYFNFAGTLKLYVETDDAEKIPYKMKCLADIIIGSDSCNDQLFILKNRYGIPGKYRQVGDL